jgi:uncharacterized protein (DUF433 family)
MKGDRTTREATVALPDEELAKRYVELHPSRPWPGEARLRESGVHVWALVGHYLYAVDQCLSDVAHDYDLPEEAVAGALAYYRLHTAEIDARLAENTRPSVA